MNMTASILPPASRLSTTRSVRNMMGWVLIALLPGIAARVRVSGIDLLLQIALALAFALLVEAVLLRLRRQPLRVFLFDGSAAVTAALFVLCLPTTASWWMLVSGICAALLLGKHLYGGLGRNPLNPAMLGVALVLVGFHDTLAAHAIDSNSWSNQTWMGIAMMDALGGVLLLWLRIVRWQIPLAVFAGAAIGAGVSWLGDDALVLRGLLAGNLVLAAFFIASDPVSGCITPRGRWLFGVGIGLLIVLLDRYASATASLPFAVLLMNCAAPWLDRKMQPPRPAELRHD